MAENIGLKTNVGSKLHNIWVSDNIGITVGTSEAQVLSPVEINGATGTVSCNNQHAGNTVTVRIYQSNMASPGDPITNPNNWFRIGSDTTIVASSKQGLPFAQSYKWIAVTAVASGAGTTPVDFYLFAATV